MMTVPCCDPLRFFVFFFSSRRRHTRCLSDWSSDVCSSDLYQQAVTLTDRVDYLAPLSNNLGWCLAVEKLLGLEIPPQAQWMRVMLTELTRLNSHLVWLGTH